MNIGYHLHCGFVDFYDPKLIIGIKQMNEDVQGYRKWIHIRVYFIRLQGSPAGTPKSKSIIIKGVILTELGISSVREKLMNIRQNEADSVLPEVIIASNRGPISLQRDEDGEFEIHRGSGGLVTALSGLAGQVDATWFPAH